MADPQSPTAEERAYVLGLEIPTDLADEAKIADAICAAVQAETERLELAFDEIACQSTTDEMDDDERKDADFEGAYDTIIKIARAAIRAGEEVKT